MPPTQLAIEAVRRSVRVALQVEGGASARRTWDSTVDPEEFLAAVGRHRVAQVLHDQAPALDLPVRVREALADVVRRQRLEALSLARELAEVVALCADHGIQALAFKGPCLALQTTGDLTARGPGDLDLLVAPADVVAVHALLERNGWQATPDLPRPGPSWGWRHLLRTGYELLLTPGPDRSWPVDLHWQLQPVRRGPPDAALAWSRRAELDLAGRQVPTLGEADAFRHASSHAAKDGWAVLRSLVDIHRLCRRPEVWEQPLRRIDLMSISATEATIGLPATIPTAVGAQVREATSAPGRLARHAQDRPLFEPERFPLTNAAVTFRRNALLGPSPGNAGRLVAGQLVPHRDLADIPDEHALTAVPRALARQARRLPRRVEEWRQARG